MTGVALSAAKHLHTFSRLKVHFEDQADHRASKLSLAGAATFIRLPRLAHALERVPAASELHVDFDRLTYVDHACLDLLMNWTTQHENAGGTLVIDWDSLHANFQSEPHQHQHQQPGRRTVA